MALPEGVKVVWDAAKAHQESTATRGRICINGLWRWQPADGERCDAVPAGGWGYCKVPGPWPHGLRGEDIALHADPAWARESLEDVDAAWYQREITVPADWAGRRIAVRADYVNSLATVYVDGEAAGQVRFPGGEVDVTALCRPGAKNVLSVHVAAMPLSDVMLSFGDSANLRRVRGTVPRKGLCGDVYLTSTPRGARIAGLRVDTSVRDWQVTFNAALEDLAEGARYVLRACVADGDGVVAEFASKPFGAADLTDGRTAFSGSWETPKLWDLHTPGNVYTVSLSLLDGAGRVLDSALPERFGFREFWIQGRDFYLNGTRIYLGVIPIDSAQGDVANATYAGARETIRRLKSFGINFVYTHNYSCTPGAHLSFEEILRAADDEGILVALSQPHFSAYDWESPDAERTNGYAQHAAFYTRVAGSHPSVVCYSMSHNSTGYAEDMNPDMIDGVSDPRDTWALNNMRRAVRAGAIVGALDPSRICYHHASGNLGPLHNSNFYANFAPVQELCDWFEHWATVGIKPAVLIEYRAPMPWDWTMYRGWYNGKREFGRANVPWEFCLAEWNAQFVGGAAYEISEREKADLRWEAAKCRAGELWHRFDYPTGVSAGEFEERGPVYVEYFTDNWRAFRTWGLSGFGPWDFSEFWLLRDGVDTGERELEVGWDGLQSPGFSPDRLVNGRKRMDMAFERSDWIDTAAATAIIRNAQPLLAYIGGKPGAFTSKDHNVHTGEVLEKQLIVINNSRATVTARCQWAFETPHVVKGEQTVAVPTGEQARIPLRFELPAGLVPGQYPITATVKFSSGDVQGDSFTVDVLPAAPAVAAAGRIALFDPVGETAALLGAMGIPCERVQADAAPSRRDTLVIGKGALTLDGPAPDVSRVRDGLKVVVFEQTGEVLERRLGFRVAEYGLRKAFRRVPDHPLLAGVGEQHLHNWRGAATVLPPRLTYELSREFSMSPTVKWCGITVPRVWRCGNRGNVASALIEKPACGDFLPVADGGFSLQYSPLMEHRDGAGVVLFCQLDVTGRTEHDPAADAVARNIFRYVGNWEPAQRRTVVYAGEEAGIRHLESAGLSPAALGGSLSAGQVLVVGPGGGRQVAGNAAAVKDWVRAGGHVLALGLTGEDASAFLPAGVRTAPGEHIAASFEPFGIASPLAGVSPADVHNRDPREMPLVAGGARVVGDGVLAVAGDSNVVFCQLVPWQIEYAGMHSFKRTYQRVAFLTTRLLANMGAAGRTPLLRRIGTPVAEREQRYLQGLYLDQPEEWDDPYRFFRW